MSVKSRLAWAVGSLGDNYAMQAINVLKDPVYTVSLKMPADQLGYALMIPRILDAFLDPLIGYVSDNWRGKWGRRRPFILAGAIPLGLLGALLWWPSMKWSQPTLFVFFLIVTMLYYVSYSLFIVPYRALGLELTKDYNERTRVQGWGMYVGLGGFIAVRCGYTAGAPKSPEVLLVLRHITQVVFLALAAASIAFYPLTRRRLAEIRQELNTRHVRAGL